jgi:hypothetical protein
MFDDLFCLHKTELCTIWWVAVQIQQLFNLKPILLLIDAEPPHVSLRFLVTLHVT